MRRTLSSVAAFVVAAGTVTAVTTAGSEPPAYGAGPIIGSPPLLTVDLTDRFKPIDQAASGSLYGLAEDGRPPDALIAPVKPKMFTQMAPNGGQLPNGETTPTGDSLKVAPVAARHGATVTIRMPDIYPNFPYRWVSMDDWLGKVRQQVRDRLASGATNIYGYELWNEPDWTWDTARAGDFNAGWALTYQAIRALDQQTAIVGPSFSVWDDNRIRGFLTAAKASGTVPQVISWHELDPGSANDLASHVRDYRQIERDLGVGPLPISINEYASPRDVGVPGALVRYIARFERSGVDTADLAFWHKPGRLSDLVVDNAKPNGAWWLYKWYGDLTGSMARTTPPSDTGRGLDGFASVDSRSRIARVVFGGAQGGDVLLRVDGLSAVTGRGDTARVQVWSTPWTGTDGALDQPAEVFDGSYPVHGGSISVPVRDTDSNTAYLMVVTPNGSGASPAQHRQYRYEAEAARLARTRTANSDQASGGRFVQASGSQGATVEFSVRVEQAGPYTVSIRHANPTVATGLGLSVNHGPAQTVPLAARNAAQFGTTEVTVPLRAGANTIRLARGSGEFAIDHIDVRLFASRTEAESGTVTDGRIIAENMANSNLFANRYSGERYVAFLTEPTSAVAVPVTAPAAGRYQLTIGYSNGNGAESTQTLAVDDTAAGIVHYPPTQFWGLIRRVSTTVALHPGTNLVRLGNGGAPVDVDYLDLDFQTG
jgi:hypothetical protein